jgi:putative transposase
MNLSRSAFYKRSDTEARRRRDASRAALREAIEEIVEEWTAYGYRRVTRELRRRGIVANHKRVARIIREEALVKDR